MLWLALVGALTVATVIVIALTGRDRRVELGSVSTQWIAEHRTEGH